MDASSAEEVIERCREQAGAFEHMQDRSDERMNDGNNYRGLMNVRDYAKKRKEVALDEDERRAKVEDAARARLSADKQQRQKADQEREEREAARRERLQQQLANPTDAGEGEGEKIGEGEKAKGPKKKKKRGTSSVGSTLSFDAEDV